MFKRKREQPAQPQPQAPAVQAWEPQPLAPEDQPAPAWRDVWAGHPDTDRAWR